MGRCYEFGVLVGEGCHHAMVVPASGGRCECETCGVACTGKFAACASILAQAGYVPPTAPAWALQPGRGEPSTASGHPSSSSGPLAADHLGAVVDAVVARLAERDRELAGRVDALSERVAELQQLAAEQVAAFEAVLAELGSALERLEEGDRRAHLFGFPRRQS